jgi:uncharacterized protein (TIGR03067 family)
MKRCLLVLSVVLLLGADKKDTVKEEVKKLQGTWEASKVTYNGDNLSSEDTGKITMTVKGDLATVGANKRVKGDYGKVRLKLDPSVTPKTIDVIIAAGSQKGTTLEGIYKLDKNTLTICAKVLGMDRPAKFESPAGESVVLIVLKKKEE